MVLYATHLNGYYFVIIFTIVQNFSLFVSFVITQDNIFLNLPPLSCNTMSWKSLCSYQEVLTTKLSQKIKTLKTWSFKI